MKETGQAVLTLSLSGQKFVHWAEELLKSGFVGFLIATVTILYIPISKQGLSVFVCTDQDCTTNQWFPIQSPGQDANLANQDELASQDAILSGQDAILAGQDAI